MQYLLSLPVLAIGVVAVASVFTASAILSDDTPAAMTIRPAFGAVASGETIDFSVVVKSKVPVNAFSGELVFDNERFTVQAISYNTSIANLWVEEPWFNRADNTIYFAGGTTKPGGFTGEDTLLSVTLAAHSAGDTTLTIHNPRIMAHNGLGTAVSLSEPLDAIFTVDTTPYVIPIAEDVAHPVTVLPVTLPLDVNGDGKLGFRDISVLLRYFGNYNPQGDFNADGKVSWDDIRIWRQLRALEE